MPLRLYCRFTLMILSCTETSSYLCVLKVMSPQWSDLVLAAHVPNSETDIFIFYSLHIETYTWVTKKE